jgi:hypothetical protein
MQPLVILRILGLLMLVSSSTLLPPIVTGLIYDDGAVLPFVEAFVLTLVTGFLLYLPVRHHRSELRLRDGFLVVVLFWTVLGVAGGLPIYLSGVYDISVTDSVFESISGITTTGATVIEGIDDLGGAADARCRRYAAVSRGDSGAGKGHQADAAHHRDCQGPVVYLSRPDRRLLSRLLDGRHVVFRRHVAFVFDGCDRRLLHP